MVHLQRGDHVARRHGAPVTDVLDRMRSDLREAMRARDREAVTALRTALAAVANAEAPPHDGSIGETRGRLVDHERLVLTSDDVERILRHQVADRHDTIARIGDRGHAAAVAALRAEIAVLERYL
jgi:uncharacterized protein YqeY